MRKVLAVLAVLMIVGMAFGPRAPPDPVYDVDTVITQFDNDVSALAGAINAEYLHVMVTGEGAVWATPDRSIPAICLVCGTLRGFNFERSRVTANVSRGARTRGYDSS